MKHVVIVAVCLVSSLWGVSADGAVFTVTSSADSGAGSLRDAIAGANGNSEADLIQLRGDLTIVLQSQLEVTSDVTIIGNGWERSVLDGGGSTRVLMISSEGSLVLDGVMVRNGAVSSSEDGGGIHAAGPVTVMNTRLEGNQAGYGGALYAGWGVPVHVLGSTIAQNQLAGVNNGAGIYSRGPLVVDRSEVVENICDVYTGCGIVSDWGAGALVVSKSTIADNTGVGIWAHDGTTGGVVSGPFVLSDSTVSGNSDGIQVHPEREVAIRNSTIVNNSGRGIIVSSGTRIEVANSILANNQNGNCWTALSSLGANIDSGTTCGFGVALDQVNTDPNIGPLADNGGPTRTHQLLAGSPAIDTGIQLASTDQRGAPRSLDGDGNGDDAPDIGAYEWNPALFIDGFSHGDSSRWITP